MKNNLLLGCLVVMSASSFAGPHCADLPYLCPGLACQSAQLLCQDEQENERRVNKFSEDAYKSQQDDKSGWFRGGQYSTSEESKSNVVASPKGKGTKK